MGKSESKPHFPKTNRLSTSYNNHNEDFTLNKSFMSHLNNTTYNDDENLFKRKSKSTSSNKNYKLTKEDKFVKKQLIKSKVKNQIISLKILNFGEELSRQITNSFLNKRINNNLLSTGFTHDIRENSNSYENLSCISELTDNVKTWLDNNDIGENNKVNLSLKQNLESFDMLYINEPIDETSLYCNEDEGEKIEEEEDEEYNLDINKSSIINELRNKSKETKFKSKSQIKYNNDIKSSSNKKTYQELFPKENSYTNDNINASVNLKVFKTKNDKEIRDDRIDIINEIDKLNNIDSSYKNKVSRSLSPQELHEKHEKKTIDVTHINQLKASSYIPKPITNIKDIKELKEVRESKITQQSNLPSNQLNLQPSFTYNSNKISLSNSKKPAIPIPNNSYKNPFQIKNTYASNNTYNIYSTYNSNFGTNKSTEVTAASIAKSIKSNSIGKKHTQNKNMNINTYRDYTNNNYNNKNSANKTRISDSCESKNTKNTKNTKSTQKIKNTQNKDIININNEFNCYLNQTYKYKQNDTEDNDNNNNSRILNKLSEKVDNKVEKDNINRDKDKEDNKKKVLELKLNALKSLKLSIDTHDKLEKVSSFNIDKSKTPNNRNSPTLSTKETPSFNPISIKPKSIESDLYHMNKNSFGAFLDNIVDPNSKIEEDEDDEILKLYEFNPRTIVASPVNEGNKKEKLEGEKFSFNNQDNQDNHDNQEINSSDNDEEHKDSYINKNNNNNNTNNTPNKNKGKGN